MKETKKILKVLGVVGIIFLSIFVVTTQYQISELSAAEEEILPLSVKIFSDRSEGVAPVQINFSSIVTNNEGEISYHWDFGNEDTSTEIKPTALYEKNGTYTCNLDIEDESGKKASDSIVINAIENSPPTVSIEYNNKNPRRPLNFVIEFVLQNFLTEKFIRIDSYGAQHYRFFRDLGFFTKIFKDASFYELEAVASDPDGDEIVSYNWTLFAPGYSTALSIPMDPTYNYSGKILYIPARDIYPAGDYSITLTVTDSAGKTRTESLDFKVKKSQLKDNLDGVRKSINGLKTKYISELKDAKWFQFVFLFTTFAIISLLKELPLPQLLIIWFFDVFLQTPPGQLTGGEYKYLKDPLKEWTDKRDWAKILVDNVTSWLQKNMPDFADNFAINFGAEDMEDLREYLEFENKRPKVTDPSPFDGEKNVDLNKPNLWINVTDLEDDRFNVSIYCEYINTTDHYKNYTDIDSSFGSFFSAPLLPLPPSQKIEWSVRIEELNHPKENYTVYYEFTTDYE